MKSVFLIFVHLWICLLWPNPDMAWSGVDIHDRQVETVTMHRYTSGPDDTPETAYALALFGAKYAAVLQCAHRLTGIDLLMADPNRKKAIFCLVADRMQFSLIEQRFDPDRGTYSVQISTLDQPD